MAKFNLTKEFFINSLIISSLAVSSLNANALGFNKLYGNTGMVITSELFFKTVEKTKPDQFALSFGMPDAIQTMRDFSGNVADVVWVYREAVAKQGKVMDANLVIVNGELKNVTLSNAS
jgi:GTP-sensing pleiotropic transcriptional regulator CodY